MNTFIENMKSLLVVCTVIFCTACKPEVKPVDPSEPDPSLPEGEVPVFESSYEAVKNMGVGWNLGNTFDTNLGEGYDGTDWEFWETGWGQAVTTQKLMDMFRKAGFGAIRVPVTWGWHTDASGKVYDEWMKRVNEVVDYVLNTGMYCIINVHHDTGADDNAWLRADPEVYKAQKERYEYLWKQIAERFKDYDHKLLFESYNEMLDSRSSWCFASFNDGYDAAYASAAYEAINNYAQSFVTTVRSTGGNNLARNLVVNTYGACNGAGDWNPHLQDPLKEMKMPEDVVEDHIIFQVHAYPLIDDMAAMRREVDNMYADLERYLVSKGGPVIIGEWGTFTENPPIASMTEFARYFISKAKEYEMGTFYWMGLSDGVARSFPAFSDPEMAEAILKAYHGEAYDPEIVTTDDYTYTYKVTYQKQWSEFNLCGRTVSLDEYSGIAFELAEAPAAGELSVKVYGESDGMEQYVGVSSANGTVMFDTDVLGAKANRVTLQYSKTQPRTVTVIGASLIRKDGTLEKQDLSTFWGCEVEVVFTSRP